MTTLIVGGDYIGSLERSLAELGLRHVEHWDGRTRGDAKRVVPRHTEVVIVLTDHVNHRLAASVGAQAEASGIPLVFSRFSSKAVAHKLGALVSSGRLRLPPRRDPQAVRASLAFAFAV